MSHFWQRMKVVESNSAMFQEMVYCFWNPEKRVLLTGWSEPFLNDFEKEFLLDIGNRWVDGIQHPQKWSHKQISLMQRIYSKVKDANYKKKRGA
jgi:hypothetical protein